MPSHHRGLAKRSEGLTGSAIDSLIGTLNASDDLVSFAMGSPSQDLIPVETFAEILAAAAVTDGSFGYVPTEGEPTLRRALLSDLASTGLDVRPAQLLVTSGGMQGLDLACKLFLDPGNVVAVESPTYTNAFLTVASYQGRVTEIPVDSEGLVVDLIPDAFGAGPGPKLIYVIPNFQNPTGTTLGLARRLELLEVAERYGSIVVEDDPYGRLRFAGGDVPSLFELDRGAGRVVSVHTFSKMLAPGLRVGWVLAAEQLVARMVAAKQAMDTCTNALGQRLVAGFIDGGFLDGHLCRVRHEYGRRKDALLRALGDCFPARHGVRWNDPEGGLFLWLSLPDGLDSDRLFPVALREGAAFVPGSAFAPAGGFSNAMRLSFASPGPERVRVGVERLAAAFDQLAFKLVAPR